MLKKLLEIITGEDNVTIEPAYLWWAIAVVVGLSLEVYSIIAGKPFDLKSYGIGVGALLALGGAGKKLGA